MFTLQKTKWYVNKVKAELDYQKQLSLHNILHMVL